MGLFSLMSKIPITAMKQASSIFSTASAGSFLAASGFETFISAVWTFICKAFYFIGKWLLYVLDIIYAYVQELCGLNMSYESLEKMVSKESDFVFNLLFTATDTIVPIIKNLIGLAIALILFFAILAVIRTEFNSIRNGSPADLKSVARDTLRAFVLLIITPMLAIVGIVASNTILKTLYNATNPSGATSLSTQLFSASTVSASSYRIYAQNGYRIPITFDFSKDQEIIDYYTDHPLTQEFRDYVTSSDNIVYANYRMFENDSFTKFDLLNDTTGTDSVKERVTGYYKIYDRSSSAASSAGGVSQYKKLQAYKTEYYVMADVIDFCINTSNTVYFKTIQEVLDSVAAMNDETTFKNILSMYGIKLLDADLKEIKLLSAPSIHASTQVRSEKNSYLDLYRSREWQVIRYTSKYYDVSDNSEPSRKMDIEYNHVRGTTDEVQGAKYIIAVERSKEIGGVTYPYFYPLTQGFSVGTTFGFDSEYIQRGQIIAAKGIFYEAKYPTAIRQSKDGSEVQFYRQKIETIEVGDASAIAGGSITKEKVSGIKGFFKKLMAPFNPKVNLNADENAITTAYAPKETKVNILSSGMLSISYMFSDNVSNGIGAAVSWIANVVQSVKGAEGVEQLGLYGLNLANLFYPTKINVLVLIAGAVLMVKITFTAIFGLINRAYELFLTIIIYPTACATIPFDDNGYKEWTKTYTQRLFSTYGLILGLNFVILLFPIIGKIEFFTAGDIALSKPIMRFKNLFSLGGIIPITVEFIKDFLNLMVVILFELVAFTLIETVPETINQITGSSDVKGIDPIGAISKVIKTGVAIVKMFTGAGTALGIKDFILALVPSKNNKARQKIKNKIKERKDKIKEGFKKSLPGSELVRAAKDKKFMNDKKKEQKDAFKNLKESMNSGSPDAKAVQNNFDKLLKSQEAYSNAIKDPRGGRQAERDQKREDGKMGKDLHRDDGEGGEGDINTEDMTDEEIKEEAEKTEKAIKHIEKKVKETKNMDKKSRKKDASEILSPQEYELLQKHKARLEQLKEEQKTRKNDNKDSKKARREVKRLQKKEQKNGALDAEDQKKLEEAEKATLEHASKQQTRENKKNERDEKSKQRAQQAKHDAKVQKKADKMKGAFIEGSRGSKGKQKKYLKQMQNAIDNSYEDLTADGFTQEQIDQMLNQIASGTNINSLALNDKQKKTMQNLVDNTKNQQQMLSIMEESDRGEAQRQANLQRYKDHGKNKSKRVRKKWAKQIAGRADTSEEEKQIQERLDEITNKEGVNSHNIKEYQKLKQRQIEIETQKRVDENRNAEVVNRAPKAGKKQAKQDSKINKLKQKWRQEAADFHNTFDYNDIEAYVNEKLSDYLFKKNKKANKKNKRK